MPDSGLADGATLTSAFYDDYIREQVIVTCLSSARPSSVEGRCIYETDTDRMMVYNGAAWAVVNEPAQTYTPTLTNVTGGTVSAEYVRVRDKVWVEGNITAGTATAAGVITVSLPSGLAVTSRRDVIPVSVILRVGGVFGRVVAGRVQSSGTEITIYASNAAGNFTLGQDVICAFSLSYSI